MFQTTNQFSNQDVQPLAVHSAPCSCFNTSQSVQAPPGGNTLASVQRLYFKNPQNLPNQVWIHVTTPKFCLMFWRLLIQHNPNSVFPKYVWITRECRQTSKIARNIMELIHTCQIHCSPANCFTIYIYMYIYMYIYISS